MRSVEVAKRIAQDHARQYRAGGGSIEHLAHGGSLTQASAPAQFGLVDSDIPGRTDRHNMDLPSGSYVLPADVVSGLGEGNSLAGAALIDRMFKSGPYGIPLPHGHGAQRNTIPEGKSYVAPPRAITPLNASPLPSTIGSGGMLPASTPSDAGTDAPVASDGLATGGTPDRVPVVVAGGEYILHPDQIAYHPMLGGLHSDDHDPKHREVALSRGHEALDSFVKARRARDIRTLKSLPGPQK